MDIELLHLILAHSAVNRLVADGGIEKCHDVERLYHIGTVGTGQRHVGPQTDVSLEGFDALGEGCVGQIAALSVAIEQNQEQRGELMTVGYATKRDARRLAVVQHGESEVVPIAIFH